MTDTGEKAPMHTEFSDLYRSTLYGFRRDVQKRERSVEVSLTALRSQDGPYAEVHHRLLLMYTEILGTIDKYLERPDA